MKYCTEENCIWIFHCHLPSLQLSTYWCNAVIESTAVRKKNTCSNELFKNRYIPGITYVLWSFITDFITDRFTTARVFWEPCDWNYLCFPGSPYRHGAYAMGSKSGLRCELNWVRDCARSPAPLILASAVKPPVLQQVLQAECFPRWDSHFQACPCWFCCLLSVRCYISMVKGLAFLCFGTWKGAVNRDQQSQETVHNSLVAFFG